MTRSTPKRYTQSQLTKIFAEQSKKTTAELRNVWNNFTDPTSLRLSLTGYKFVVQDLKLKTYVFELGKPLTNKNLLQLEKFFPGPYYYWSSTSKFIVLDDQDAVWLELLGNDLPSYLDSLESNT